MKLFFRRSLTHAKTDNWYFIIEEIFILHNYYFFIKKFLQIFQLFFEIFWTKNCKKIAKEVISINGLITYSVAKLNWKNRGRKIFKNYSLAGPKIKNRSMNTNQTDFREFTNDIEKVLQIYCRKKNETALRLRNHNPLNSLVLHKPL